MPLCSAFVPFRRRLTLTSRHTFILLYMCIDIVLKGDTDGSFKKENHTLQEQVSRFKKELQQAHDE